MLKIMKIKKTRKLKIIDSAKMSAKSVKSNLGAAMRMSLSLTDFTCLARCLLRHPLNMKRLEQYSPRDKGGQEAVTRVNNYIFVLCIQITKLTY